MRVPSKLLTLLRVSVRQHKANYRQATPYGPSRDHAQGRQARTRRVSIGPSATRPDRAGVYSGAVAGAGAPVFACGVRARRAAASHGSCVCDGPCEMGQQLADVAVGNGGDGVCDDPQADASRLAGSGRLDAGDHRHRRAVVDLARASGEPDAGLDRCWAGGVWQCHPGQRQACAASQLWHCASEPGRQGVGALCHFAPSDVWWLSVGAYWRAADAALDVQCAGLWHRLVGADLAVAGRGKAARPRSGLSRICGQSTLAAGAARSMRRH